MKLHVRKIREHTLYGIIISLLAFISAGLLVFEVSSQLYADQIALLHKIDLAIALIFLGDFVIGISTAENKRLYARHNWPDLIAGIPLSGSSFQSLRLLRVIRVVARIWKIGDIADHLILGSSKYIYATTVITVIILSASISFFTLEHGINPDLHNYFDAVWWTFVTAFGVGYGDIVPISVAGRIIGILLMVAGMCIFGGIAGYVGSYFIHEKLEKNIKREVRKAEEQIEEALEN